MSQIIFTGGGGVTPGSAVETLTGNTGGPVSPTANNINVVGGENINTAGTPGTSTIAVNLNETIHWSSTNSAGTTGVIYLGATGAVGGFRFMHNFGTATSTYLGENAGNFTNTGTENTGIGNFALSSISIGEDNTACGSNALAALTTGFNNVAVGGAALLLLVTGDVNTTGTCNCAVGTLAGRNLLTGAYNVLLGSGNDDADVGAPSVGVNYTSSESSNILISNPGVTGESHVIRIGTTGSANAQQNQCFIAGIFGVTTGGTGTAVFVDNTGKLGTVVSSRRFKKNIEHLNLDATEGLMNLKPASFSYINDPESRSNLGLIAEEVEEHIPSLVTKDNEGRPFTVKYHELPILLLKEIQKQNDIINSLMRRITMLEQASGDEYEL